MRNYIKSSIWTNSCSGLGYGVLILALLMINSLPSPIPFLCGVFRGIWGHYCRNKI
ncbi:hypothetical protein SAMN05660706_11468 [Desulfoscipio geothermicus DSM 3669]|uniref:Uncharacterized protein n=1 Tax=Desulfoscipio geothermicus DSM 3669 TaxID=1121426 RepID=A0A1I6DP24_9FIRM|nr:hypothetical protein SAMN05660706_11468 [Desulfoscipio geothermicus DSM 3669]